MLLNVESYLSKNENSDKIPQQLAQTQGIEESMANSVPE